MKATYREISLYAPDRTPCRIDLSENTNLHGAPPCALAAIRATDPGALTSYPSLYAQELKRVIAGYIGVNEHNVVTGCGSDDILDSAIRAFCESSDKVVTSNPSFSMIPLHARMNGVACEQISLTPDLNIDSAALVAARGAVTYLCSPNNPTGNSPSQERIEEVIASAAGLVILDEAYAEFSGRSLAQRAAQSPRLLVVRTLSKAFGLAGLRIGYGIGAPETVSEVEKSRGPFKVSSLAERAAIAALTSDLDWIRQRIADTLATRDQVASQLKSMGLTPLPSDANFLMIPVHDAREIAARMRARDVAVREFTALPQIGDAIRMGIGPSGIMQIALDALRESLQ